MDLTPLQTPFLNQSTPKTSNLFPLLNKQMVEETVGRVEQLRSLWFHEFELHGIKIKELLKVHFSREREWRKSTGNVIPDVKDFQIIFEICSKENLRHSTKYNAIRYFLPSTTFLTS